MNKHLLFLPVLLFGALGAGAQDFVNGGFENNAGRCLINASNTEFNANVRNTKAFGNFKKPDIANSDCGFGAAKEGSWFVGLATNVDGSGKAEAISLELNTALVSGRQYSLTFYTRMRHVAPNLELGVATTDSTQGKVFYTCSTVNANAANDWTEQTIRFTAPANGKYITVKAVSEEINSGAWLDGFALHPVSANDHLVKNAAAEKPATAHFFDATIVYPNPNEGVFSVNTDWTGEMNVTVYNTVGAAVKSFTCTKDSSALTNLDLSNEEPGLYFIELATANSKVTKKVVVTK